MSNSIDLGFAENCDSWLLESRFFPSKIGGKPAWLDLKHVPDAKQLACNYCKTPCVFLCQVYAPYEEDAKAFHRTIYVFICKNAYCCKDNCNGNVKVFRSQLEKCNDFYPSEPPIEEKDWRSDINVNKWVKTCHVCGIFSSSHCIKCKKVNYCCRSHQCLDWKNKHQKTCGSQDQPSTSDFLFPEYEMVIEKENYEEKEQATTEEEELKKFEELVKLQKAGTLQSEIDVDKDLSAMANELKDKTFFKFQEIVKNEPEQILRYNRGGKPLYISSSNLPENIPNCEKCGSERQFEFQVMPQLLLYLKIENVFSSIDWGILAVYTCKNSCVPESNYLEEFVWKQDIVKDNPDE